MSDENGAAPLLADERARGREGPGRVGRDVSRRRCLHARLSAGPDGRIAGQASRDGKLHRPSAAGSAASPGLSAAPPDGVSISEAGRLRSDRLQRVGPHQGYPQAGRRTARLLLPYADALPLGHARRLLPNGRYRRQVGDEDVHRLFAQGRLEERRGGRSVCRQLGVCRRADQAHLRTGGARCASAGGRGVLRGGAG